MKLKLEPKVIHIHESFTIWIYFWLSHWSMFYFKSWCCRFDSMHFHLGNFSKTIGSGLRFIQRHDNWIATWLRSSVRKESENSYLKLKKSRWTDTWTHTRKQTRNISIRQSFSIRREQEGWQCPLKYFDFVSMCVHVPVHHELNLSWFSFYINFW